MSRRQNRYITFFTVFLVMHFTGLLVAGLPYVLNAMITSLVVLGTLLVCVWRKGDRLPDLAKKTGTGKATRKDLLPGLVLATALLLSYPLLGAFLHAELFLAKDWLLNLAGLFLTGGLTEEILFRGYLFGGLRQKQDFRKAAINTAIFFSMAHLLLFAYMSWPVALLSTLLAGASAVPLAFLFEKGNNTVWSPAIVHTVIRTIGLVITTDEKHFPLFSLLWITLCMIIPYLVLFFYRDFRAIWIYKRAA